MITRDQANAHTIQESQIWTSEGMKPYQIVRWEHDAFHYTGRHECTRTIGPRGGITVKVTSCRRSGKTQTWKRDPARFRVPVKYGLYESAEITEANAADWHLASECPLNAHNA